MARGGKELVECTVRHNNLNSVLWIGQVVTHAGRTEVSGWPLFSSSELSQPETGEVSVVDRNLGGWIGLGVRADVARPLWLILGLRDRANMARCLWIRLNMGLVMVV